MLLYLVFPVSTPGNTLADDDNEEPRTLQDNDGDEEPPCSLHHVCLHHPEHPQQAHQQGEDLAEHG